MKKVRREPKRCRMIETKFLGPTNFRGSRVKATFLDNGNSKTFSWAHEWDILENHTFAAEQLAGSPAIQFATVDKGGYIFGVKF